MFRNYSTLVSPQLTRKEIEEFSVWQVLNRSGDGMVHHSLVHVARKKTKLMDLLDLN